MFLFNLMNELRFIHGEEQNNFLKAKEWTDVKENMEESMKFFVSSSKISCYIQNKDEKVCL